MKTNTAKYPAPWKLNGRWYIFLYKFSSGYRKRKFFSGSFGGDFTGFGTVMLVDYRDSTAGPYSELLFIPGKFRYGRDRLHSITKIYVSTMESVVNGRENWGIPKELADFSFEKLDGRRERITVRKEGRMIFTAVVRKRRLTFPVDTRFFRMPLVQECESRVCFTEFRGRGRGIYSVLESVNVDPEHFPDLYGVKPLAGVGVEDFDLEFPPARVADG